MSGPDRHANRNAVVPLERLQLPQTTDGARGARRSGLIGLLVAAILLLGADVVIWTFDGNQTLKANLGQVGEFARSEAPVDQRQAAVAGGKIQVSRFTDDLKALADSDDPLSGYASEVLRLLKDKLDAATK